MNIFAAFKNNFYNEMVITILTEEHSLSERTKGTYHEQIVSVNTKKLLSMCVYRVTRKRTVQFLRPNNIRCILISFSWPTLFVIVS